MPHCTLSVLTALIAITLGAPATAGRVCLDTRHGTVSSNQVSEEVGRFSAFTAWQVTAAARFGPSWANGENAKGGTYFCDKKTSAVGLNLWECTFRAYPCRYE